MKILDSVLDKLSSLLARKPKNAEPQRGPVVQHCAILYKISDPEKKSYRIAVELPSGDLRELPVRRTEFELLKKGGFISVKYYVGHNGTLHFLDWTGK